jgi:hypothetical protein
LHNGAPQKNTKEEKEQIKIKDMSLAQKKKEAESNPDQSNQYYQAFSIDDPTNRQSNSKEKYK